MMTRYFPWRVFRKSFVTQIFLLNLTFIAAVAGMAIVFGQDLFQVKVLWLSLLFLAISMVLAAIAAYRVASPLKRVILQALRLAHKKRELPLEENEEEEDLFADQVGEYFELEQALDKIRRKLRKRRIQLSHEREESQALMSFLADAVVNLALDERIKYFNSNFAKHFLDAAQLRATTEGLDLKLIDVFRDEEVLATVRQCLREGRVFSLQKKMSSRIDPAGRYFSMTVSPLHEEKTREVYAGLVLFHDITEYKRAELIRVEFVENASHELRTPLTSIKGFVSTAVEDAEGGRYEMVPEFLRVISKSVDRLIELVNDLLTISGLENDPSLKMEDVRVQELTDDVIQRLSPLASDKRIMVKARYDVSTVKGDYRLIDQVLTNLIGNAIKYVQVGGQVEVTWDEDREQHMIRLSIKDNGPGIAEEHLGRLFERFYRVDKGRSRDVGGTGLGLSIVKHIMQSHGGQVTVRSQIGMGSEFICLIPSRP